jgi:hypothetical protein
MLKFPIAILIAVVTLLGGFYGGYKMGQTTPARASAATTGTGAGAFAGLGGANAAAQCTAPTPNPSASAGARGFRRGATGVISNLTSGTMTIHNAVCNTDTKVTFSPTVIVRKTVVGSATDLQENLNVTIQGQRQPDGSVTATSIQIVPAGGAGAGAGAATGG